MRRRALRVLLAAAVTAAVFLPPPAFAEGAPLVLSPGKWEFGSIPAGSRAFLTLQVVNPGSQDVTVTVIPTCDCLSTSLSKQLIPAGGKVEFRLSFLAEADEAGYVRESYIILTDLKALDHFYYQVHGFVKGAPPSN
jgi:hypothetical protein